MKKARRREVGAPVERLKGETVPPIRTLQLINAIGVSKTARAIGTSTTTLHKARKHNLVSKVIEVAADGELRRIADGMNHAALPAHQIGGGRTAAFLLEVDESKRGMVEKFAEMMGGKLIAA